MKNTTGTIFDIQHYSIHDGPGIRTNVFVKGCPLHCRWCQNPESQKAHPELIVHHDKCIGCANCTAACPTHAITVTNEKAKTNRSLCTHCGACLSVCPPSAREITGETKSAWEIFLEVNKDRLFYESSGGGVTMTGGEILTQPNFTTAVLTLCKENGLHTAIETCGFGAWEKLSPILDVTDIVLYDVKHMEPERHKWGTSVSNDLILENLVLLSQEKKIPLIVRTPIIPSFNDSVENMESMARFIKKELPTCLEVNLLPYHPLGVSKKEQLEDEDNECFERPTAEKMAELKSVLETHCILVK